MRRAILITLSTMVLIIVLFGIFYFINKNKSPLVFFESKEEVEASPYVHTLVVGETYEFPNARLTFNGVISDTRCDDTEACTESGGLVVSVTGEVPGKTETFTLTTGGEARMLGAAAITIQDVHPLPKNGESINPDYYTITFRTQK